MKRMKIIFLTLILILGVVYISVSAGEFYLHDNDQYWWFHVSEPHFYAVVPNNADLYVNKVQFGYEFLEMSWDNGTIVMEIGVIPGATTSDGINFVAKRWSPFLKDELVFANREITTSNDLQTFFYAVEGIGHDGKKAMIRSVYFHKDDDLVYLAMYLPNNKYEGDMRNHWLRAVNEFEW